MKRMALRITLITCINLLVPQQHVFAETCPNYDFQSLFYDDYYPGIKWDTSSGNRTITWSMNATVINDESISRTFTSEEAVWIRSAFQSWDDALDTLNFSESMGGPQAEIVIGYVALTSAVNQPNAYAYWNAWWKNDIRNKATIKLKSSQANWFNVKNQFIHAIQHELGNILGLGDIRPTEAFTSVQEDGWRPPYGQIPLSDFDTGMMRQLYGESTCPSTFSPTSIEVDLELKAKQEAEAKAAAELLAKQEADVAAKAAVSKKKAFTCKKGKLVTKVKGVNPRCPTGFKRI